MISAKRQLAAQRLEETIAYLWGRYRQDPRNVELRNRLVEHYTPLVQRLARQYIRRFDLRERDTAVGDALLLLVLRLVPDYDGQSEFRHWAEGCIRQKMLERQRTELQRRRRFLRPGRDGEWPEIEALLVRPQEPGSEVRFAELARALPARDAALLWLRIYRQLPYREIASAMDMTQATVIAQVRGAIGMLRDLVRPPEESKEVRSQESEVRSK